MELVYINVPASIVIKELAFQTRQLIATDAIAAALVPATVRRAGRRNVLVRAAAATTHRNTYHTVWRLVNTSISQESAVCGRRT